MSVNGVLGSRNELKSLELFRLISVVAVELIDDVALMALKSVSPFNELSKLSAEGVESYVSPSHFSLSLYLVTTPFSITPLLPSVNPV